MHELDRFRQGLNKYTPIGQATGKKAKDLAVWLKDDGIDLFSQAFKQETNIPVSSLTGGKLVEQAFPKGLNDIDVKYSQNSYYSANAKIFTETCLRIASVVADAHSSTDNESYASRHYGLLKNLVLDALALLEQWATHNQNVPGAYGVVKNYSHDPLQISHAVEQLMYGGSPFLAFTDNATDAGTALLRVALETRLRFGFGLLGVREIATGAVSPLNLSKVLNAIATHENSMNLAVPLQHISRLYGWSNIYVHVGMKHFTWSPIFASWYLVPILRGVNNSGSVNSGIRIRRDILVAVQNEAEAAHALKAGEEIIRVDPEKCSVVLLE